MLHGTYWLTRIFFLRSVAFIYSVAFAVALFQNKELIGRNGLLPAHLYLNEIRQQLGDEPDIWKMISAAPTILWFVDMEHLDFWLDFIALCGLGISVIIFFTGAANMIAMATLWVLYHSIVNVGQTWYSFGEKDAALYTVSLYVFAPMMNGWESQLLETGFLAMWMCPVLVWDPLPQNSPTPIVVILGFRWLIIRIMFGAGMIKIRGDKCWRDLTCMNYHYETQPNPNPAAYFMHQSPELMHKFEVLSNHFAELVSPIFLLIPYRPSIMFGGIVQIGFMAMIVISGNLSFLNHLTMLPSICCFDDKFLSMLFTRSTNDKVIALQNRKETYDYGYFVRHLVNGSLLALLAYLSIPVVQNLFSSHQRMNTSFEPLRLVNTYGAFGSITKKRTEVIMQGTDSPDPLNPNTLWLEYEFKCKPGKVDRIPCLISPYHYRLDWLMWFAAFQNYRHNPWLVHLVAKMLQNDEFISGLLEHNPFLGKKPPRFIRLEHYSYKFTQIGTDKANKGYWWTRRRIGEYMPIVDYEAVKPILKRFGWIDKD